MCGRYTLNKTFGGIVDLYRLTLPEEEPKNPEGKSLVSPNFNVAPTTVMPIIRAAP